MLIEIKIKLTSEMLGNKADSIGNSEGESIKKFNLTPDGSGIIIEKPVWTFSIREAAISLGLNGNELAERIRLRDSIRSPTLGLYKRRGKGDVRYSHQMIRIGAELTFTIMLTDRKSPYDSKPPEVVTIKDIEEIFTIIGKYTGLSPFGGKLGFGRFDILSVKEYVPTDADFDLTSLKDSMTGLFKR